MEERSRRLAAAKQKLQVYKQQHKQPEPQSNNQQDRIVLPEEHTHNHGHNSNPHPSPVEMNIHSDNIENQTQIENSEVSLGETNNYQSFIPASQSEIHENTGPVQNLMTNSEPDSYFTVTPLIPVSASDSSNSHPLSPSFELGHSVQYPYTHSTGIYQPSASQQADENNYYAKNNGHQHVFNDEEMTGPELRSLQHNQKNTDQHQVPDHPYFNDFQQMSSQGQDAFELELSQLRQDNSHLSRRESELIGHLQDTERTLQDLRRERDALAQEVRSELGPLKDKVNMLFEENNIFRQNLDDMTTKVEIAETEIQKKQGMYEEMQGAFILVSNAKMELAGELDFEKERVKVLELTLQERNSQIESLIQHNHELIQGAEALEKELDAYAVENVDLREREREAELTDAHARIILLEKELSELRIQIKSVTSASGSHHLGQHQNNCLHTHENEEHLHEHGHNHGHSHSHEHEHTHDHDHSGHGQSLEHGPDLSQQLDGAQNQNPKSQDQEHQHGEDQHIHSGCDHNHSHEHNHHSLELEHNHGSHGYSHSLGSDTHEGQLDHTYESEFGKGGVELTATEKRQARLEWENQTYREELEKLASLLKTKTADASALSIYKAENDKMKNELERLEHLVIQLQGENDTIGDYISLYQSQRLALKEKAMQKEAEMVTLGKEREQLRVQMEELNNILKSYNKNEATTTTDQPSKLPVEKINQLITGINTNFHPCGVCSGRLLNV